ncbi:TPA: hypothetical protein ACQJL1_003852 [Citrobacter freundii]
MNNPFEPFMQENTIIIGENVKFGDKIVINVKGGGHQILIGDNVTLRNITINIIGEKNTFSVGNNSNLRGVFHIRQPGSSLVIGDHVTSVTANVFAMEGKSITIGSESMLSSGIFIRTSDEHPIYDIQSGLRINDAKDVTIGNKVWISEGVTINKGSIVPDGSIIGSRSVVIGKLRRPNSIYAGVPVKLIREGVRWDRKLPPIK